MTSSAVSGAATGTTPRPPRLGRRTLAPAAVGVALLASLVAGLTTDAPTVWGLLPIGMYAVLSLTGMNLVIVTAVALGSAVLVTSLGTLTGALAIAAPLLVPIAARAGFTRSATAATMFLGGCAGLALAPFAGSNIAIMKTAGWALLLPACALCTVLLTIVL